VGERLTSKRSSSRPRRLNSRWRYTYIVVSTPSTHRQANSEKTSMQECSNNHPDLLMSCARRLGKTKSTLSCTIKTRETYLRLDQDQINEQHDKVMLDILVGKAFAPWALRESYAFAESLVIGFAVRGIKCADRIATLDADWHLSWIFVLSARLLFVLMA
jgi:hypothetical protein